MIDSYKEIQTTQPQDLSENLHKLVNLGVESAGRSCHWRLRHKCSTGSFPVSSRNQSANAPEQRAMHIRWLRQQVLDVVEDIQVEGPLPLAESAFFRRKVQADFEARGRSQLWPS